MSGNVIYGMFIVEGYGSEPWTPEDEQRLRGLMPSRRQPGRVLPPHVLTTSGPFFVGTVPLQGFPPLSGGICAFCRRPKVKPRHTDGARFCFGCGALQ